jgi:hypothetical protein
MHEFGLAQAVAAELRAHRGWSRARVLLADPSFGHSPEALRLHLALQAADLDLTGVDIVVVPVPAVCLRCGTSAEISSAGDSCSACDGPVLPTTASASVALDIDG